MALTQQRMLDLWAAGQGRLPGECALLLLDDEDPAPMPGASAALSLGARDAALLRLRGQLFGGALPCLAQCPHCGARVETVIALAELAPGMAAAGAAPPRFGFACEGFDLECRPLLAGDAPALEALRQPDRIAVEILRRCVISASRAGVPVPPDALPPVVRDAAAEAILDADPFAQVEAALVCPDCGTGWQATLDPAAFLWQEIDAWAWRAMAEVQRLAQAYGWTEAECLALPPVRRAAYLQLASA